MQQPTAVCQQAAFCCSLKQVDHFEPAEMQSVLRQNSVAYLLILSFLLGIVCQSSGTLLLGWFVVAGVPVVS